MNIQRIKADIITAKNNISYEGNPTNDEYLYDVSAYHIQQAIEKELKYILHNVYGEDDTTKRFKTHNISSLLVMLNEYDNDFINNHKDIAKWADTITEWEASTRYGENLVSAKNSIEEVIGIADSFLNEILNYNLDNNRSEENIVKRRHGR